MEKFRKSDLQREMRQHLLSEHGIMPYGRVYAEINGVPMYLNEAEVRYLQVKCAREAQAGRFEAFRASHKIWNGRSKRGHRPMAWLPSGRFDNSACSFEPGFYDTSAALHIELLKLGRGGSHDSQPPIS